MGSLPHSFVVQKLRFPHISSCEIKRLVGQAVEERSDISLIPA